MSEESVDFQSRLQKGGEKGTVTSSEQTKLADKYWFQGLPISVENKKGSYRAGVDKSGRAWKVFMHHDYGYVRGTEGNDGEHLDVYVGDDDQATHAYVVHQVKPDTGEYDEDKVMLGFSDEASAKTSYLKQYTTPKFFGGIRAIPMDAFKLMLRAHSGKRLTTGPAKRFLIKGMPQEIVAQLQWEPPGGSHPQTWRAEYGGKFLYRRARPDLDIDVAESGQLFTSPEKRAKQSEANQAAKNNTVRAQTILMTPKQHEAAAEKEGKNRLLRDFHLAEQMKKLDLTSLREKLTRDAARLVSSGESSELSPEKSKTA